MISIPDIGHVYPKSGLDADIRLDTKPRFVSSGSLFLPGGSTDDVEVDGLGFTSDGAWSTALWMKSDDFGTGKIWDLRNSSSTARLTLEVAGNDITVFHTGIGSAAFTGAASHIEDGTWHHVALSGAVSGSDNVYTLYIDGQQFGAASSALARIDISLADQGYIGNIYTGSGAPITGNIAHLGFWNTDLEQAEIRALMGATTYAEAVTKSGNTPAAYYLFEADADASVGSPDGQLGSNAAIVGDRARLPRGVDLTGNRMDARCYSGRAIDLDGTGDYISLAHPSDLDGFFNTGGTISMWINMTSTATYERLFDFSGGTYMYLKGSFSGYVFNKDFGTTDGNWTYNGNGGVGLGEWFHFCLSYNAASTSNNPDLYINGVLQTIDGETAPEGSAGADTTEKLIGIAADKSASPLDASLADIKLFTSTVTAAQALELYQNPEQILPTGIASSALKCWLPCSDYDIATADNSLNGLYAQDASGNGNHGALTNCGMIFSQPTIPQLGLRSSSSAMLIQDDEIVTVSSHEGVNIFSGADGGGSVAFWAFINSDGESSHGRILAKSGDYELMTRNESSGTCELKLEVPGFAGGTAAHHSAKTVNIGQWNHVVMTYVGLYNTNPIFYINGSTAPNTTDTQTTGAFTDSGDLVLGNQTYGARSMDGILSEVALWSSILDADAIAVLYNSGVQGFDPTSDSGDYDVSSDLTAFYKLDNPVTIADLSTNSNTGTVSGTPNIATVPEGTTADTSVFGTLTTKKPPFGFAGCPISDFDDERYFELSEDAIDFGTGNLTFSFWFKLASPVVLYQRLLAQYGTGGQIGFYFGSSTRLDFYLTGPGGTASELITDSDGWHDIWHHVVVRREAAALFSFYCRGLGEAAKETDDSTTNTGSLSSTRGLRFGSVETGSGYSSGASFAFLKIWVGEAISDAEVEALHQSGARFLRGL